MATVNVYLTFDGQCEEAFNFYANAFGKEIAMWNKFSDMPPPQEGMPPMPEELKNRVMHVSLPISAETVIMGSDSMPGMHRITQGNNFSMSINVDSREEADHLFQNFPMVAR